MVKCEEESRDLARGSMVGQTTYSISRLLGQGSQQPLVTTAITSRGCHTLVRFICLLTKSLSDA